MPICITSVYVWHMDMVCLDICIICRIILSVSTSRRSPLHFPEVQWRRTTPPLGSGACAAGGRRCGGPLELAQRELHHARLWTDWGGWGGARLVKQLVRLKFCFWGGSSKFPKWSEVTEVLRLKTLKTQESETFQGNHASFKNSLRDISIPGWGRRGRWMSFPSTRPATERALEARFRYLCTLALDALGEHSGNIWELFDMSYTVSFERTSKCKTQAVSARNDLHEVWSHPQTVGSNRFQVTGPFRIPRYWMEHGAPRRSGAQVPALWALGPTRCDVGCFHGRWAQRPTWPPGVFMVFIIWLGMGQKRSKTIVIAWLGNIHKCQLWLWVPFGRLLTHTHMLFINSLHGMAVSWEKSLRCESGAWGLGVFTENLCEAYNRIQNYI